MKYISCINCIRTIELSLVSLHPHEWKQIMETGVRRSLGLSSYGWVLLMLVTAFLPRAIPKHEVET